MARLFTEEEVRHLIEEVTAPLLARIAQLEAEVARLKKDSSTSSKPPSSDITKPPRKDNRGRGRRKKPRRGGQTGHARTEPQNTEQGMSNDEVTMFRAKLISGPGSRRPPFDILRFLVGYSSVRLQCGDVYLNGEAFCEKETAAEVVQVEQSWHCRVDADVTIIRAHFGRANPNTGMAEINVRECLFMPELSGLKYVTVDGFRFMHAAANWAPPVVELQTGAVGPRMGKHWIIENCEITNARCVGIILGHAPGVDYNDIDAYGDHIIRNNVIRRCGQAGIAGQKGATRSVISGNLIEDTNYRKEFGGWETAAIKFHNSVDTVISGNLIRGVFRQQQGAFGIWIDFGNQGIQITRNVIYNTEAARKSSFGDDNSLVAPDVTGLAIKDHPLGATITFSISDAPRRVNGPQVNAELVGVFPTVGQTIADREGNPITIDTDMNGKRFSCPIPGPLANVQRGKNAITWSMRKQ